MSFKRTNFPQDWRETPLSVGRWCGAFNSLETEPDRPFYYVKASKTEHWRIFCVQEGRTTDFEAATNAKRSDREIRPGTIEYPTDPFTNLEPHNPSIDELYDITERRSTDIKATKL